MVWGMEIPSTFGTFWPRGQFEGPDDAWSKRLDDWFYSEEEADGDHARLLAQLNDVGCRYSYFVGKKLIAEPGSWLENQGPAFGNVEAHEPPTFYLAEKAYKELGALIALNYGILAVSAQLKCLIERFEKGAHQFFPIEIRMPEDRAYPEPYFVLRIGQFFDAFSPEKSQPDSYKSWPDYPGYYSLEARPAGSMCGLAFSKSSFKDAHLWRERGLNENVTCLSNSLRSAAKDAGLLLPKHYPMREIE